MRAIILAAGLGTRLGGAVPKPLAEITPGLTLLGNQAAILARLLTPDAITAVVGHEAGRVRAAHPTLRFVTNPRHTATNTAASLLCGLRGVDDDVLWANGDLYFDEPTARRLIDAAPDSSRMLVDHSPPRAEAVKHRLAPDGTIAELSKSVARPDGEALGLNIVVQRDLPAFVAALARCSDADYFEKALDECVRSGAFRLIPVDVGAAFCREVDYPQDLMAVRAHLGRSGRA